MDKNKQGLFFGQLDDDDINPRVDEEVDEEKEGDAVEPEENVVESEEEEDTF